MNNLRKTLRNIIKAAIGELIVAFIYAIIIILGVNIFFSNEIQKINNIVDLIAVKSTNKIQKEVKINIETNMLEHYPEYGTRYATLSIPSINVKLPVYNGVDLDLLAYGIGHTTGYYFPGEGGTILYAGHNTSNMLMSLPELKKNESIIVETTYGKYTYKLYDTKILNEDNFFDEIRPKQDKEILILYTCYPVTAITPTPYRYVAYASKEES